MTIQCLCGLRGTVETDVMADRINALTLEARASCRNCGRYVGLKGKGSIEELRQAALDAFAHGYARPDPAALGPLVPNIAGQFDSFQRWVAKASSHIDKYAVCIDQRGRRCLIGADFMRADKDKAFPIVYFWDCEKPE